MKKQFVLILSMLCIAFGGYAQTEGGRAPRQAVPQSQPQQQQQTPRAGAPGRPIEIKSKSYNYEFSVGPRVGIGLGMLSNGEYNGEKVNIGKGAGFAFDAGLGLNVRFGGKDSKGRPRNGQGLFGIGLELNYAMRCAGTEGDKTLSLGYFDVPLLLQFYPGFNTKQLKNLYIEVGPTFSALVSKSPKTLKMNETMSYVTGDLKGGDVLGTIGLGYRFNRSAANDGFYMNIRYNIGFSKLAGNFPSKMSSAELTLGYYFKCVGGKKKNESR